MKFQIHDQEPDGKRVDLEGDLDFHSSPDLRHTLAKLVEARPGKILFDLKKVPYIDSSGLATFVELFQKIKRTGGRLVLYNLNPAVRSVFEIAKLDSIFHLAKDEKEALSLLA